MTALKHFTHGIFYPLTGIQPIPLQPAKVFHTEGAQTNYELWQVEKFGNFIKAVGSEHIERFTNKENKV